jgi:hypothetical protein
LGMVLDWYSDCSLVVWWRLPNLVEAVEYTEDCCWECCYIGSSPLLTEHLLQKRCTLLDEGLWRWMELCVWWHLLPCGELW